ncbi:hypothetical protein FRC19_002355 [Serendipita sp. 401]|nr:hypothetical protein FRC19_002355 [Serendipita sp. 401]
MIRGFLGFLAASNPLYKKVQISEENLALYPEDDLLPMLAESVVISPPSTQTDQLLQESRGLRRLRLAISLRIVEVLQGIFWKQVDLPSNVREPLLPEAVNDKRTLPIKGDIFSIRNDTLKFPSTPCGYYSATKICLEFE